MPIDLFPYIREYFKINTSVLYLFGFYAALFFCRPSDKLRSPAMQPFIIIAAVGLALRISWLFISSHEPRMVWGTDLIDNDWIHVQAIDLLQGKWFMGSNGLPSGRRPIGYPIFIAILYKIFGVNLWVLWTAHLILFALSLYFIYRMAQLTFGNRAANLAAFFFSIHPISIYSIKLVTDEHLFLPMFYGGLYALMLEIKRGRQRWLDLPLYGLVFGYAMIIRTHAIFAPALILIAYQYAYKNWIKSFVSALIVFLIMQGMNVPWMLRNYKVWKVPVMYTATSCFVYAQVNSTALAKEGDGHIPSVGEPGYSQELEQAMITNEGKAHQLCGKLMKEWIVENPGTFALMGIRKLLVFMAWDKKQGVWPFWFQYTEGHYNPQGALNPKVRKALENYAFIFYYIVFITALLSLMLLIKKRRPEIQSSAIYLWILATCFIFWFMEHMIIYSDRKYRFPLEPLMILIASYFCDRILGKFWNHQKDVQS